MIDISLSVVGLFSFFVFCGTFRTMWERADRERREAHRRREESRSLKRMTFRRLLAPTAQELMASGAFSAAEGASLLRVLSSLQVSDSFECSICCSSCDSPAPSHGHGATCASCFLKFAETEVGAGRVPTCATCRDPLTKEDLLSVGASEELLHRTELLLRARHAGRLAVILDEYREVLTNEELRALSVIAQGEDPGAAKARRDAASEAYIQRTATACPACHAPCHRISGCPFVRCRCGESFPIQTVVEEQTPYRRTVLRRSS